MASLIIKVDYYDDEERQKIEKNFPDDFPLIESSTGREVDISYEDFKVYSVFGFQYDGDPRHTGFTELSKVSAGISRFEMLLHYDKELKSLVRSIPDRPVINDVSEELGIAGGLSIASEIYSLTQADWQMIPQTTDHKDFDFRTLAASHRKYINIEAKGCITEKNSLKDSAVSKHKKKIIDKKGDSKFKNSYDYAIDTCLGIITVADPSNVLQAWIVDPSFNRPNLSPAVLKLLKRMYYYYQLMYSISPKAIITTALANRYSVLQVIGDLDRLDGQPLVNYNMEKIILSPTFFQGRTADVGGTITGRLYFTEKQLIFIGIQAECFDLLIGQNYEDIRNFSISPSTKRIILNGIVNNRYANLIDRLSDAERIVNRRTKNNQILFNISMEMTIASSGMCFSYLTI
jgi:hypothetical protein